MHTTGDNNYDAIVIGSGWGGLTTASLLAQIGKKRVLVLERHFKLGGFSHSFRRKKYEWDVGVHYVGGMNSGALARRMMDLVTRNGVQWHKMGSPYERFMFPQGSFDVPDSMEAYRTALIERFPSEAKQLTRYFQDLKIAQNWIVRWAATKLFSNANPLTALLKLRGKGLVTMKTSDYLQRFRDPLLRAILPAQWPDYGSPPHESAFGIHAIVATDFFNGGYYPLGGAQKMSDCAAEAIEAHGGKCKVNHHVKRIEIHNNRATGVVAEVKGKEVRFTAPKIISNAGVWTTFGKLISDEHCHAEREQMRRVKPGVSALMLFVGLKDDPRNHGFDDANYWLYDNLDHKLGLERWDGESAGRPTFVSFGSLRNPGQEPHTAQVITFAEHASWDDFQGTQWMRRGREYEALKEQKAQEMLQSAENFMPGLTNIVDYYELSTPLTVESFTGHTGGMIYGQTCNPSRIDKEEWKIATSLKNLYLTGSDVGTPGINGAMIAGVMAAGKLLGPLGMPRIMTRAYT